MNSSLSFAKVWFIVSFAGLAFLYGTAVGKWEWFPHSFLDRAMDQARSTSFLTFQDQGPTTFTGGRRYDRKGVQIPRPGEVQSGLTLISSSWKGADGWDPGLRLITDQGKVLHKWRIDRDEIFQGGGQQRKGDPSKAGVQGSHLLPNGDVVLNLEYVGMVRLDACSNVLWTLGEGNHHSISRADDGSFWVPGVSSEPRAGNDRYPDGFPGLGGKEVWVDRILHVSENGKILDDIDVLDVIYKNGLERYIPKVLGGPWPSAKSVHTDITHINDVEPLSASMADEYPLFQPGDLLVSLRSLSLVFVFDPETMEVKWHSSDPFIYQHDPDFIGNGWIGVFDNNYDFDGGDMLGGSRIVALQPHTDSLEVRFQPQRPGRFYTSVQGKWQQLDNGNMLLSEANTGRAVEVNPNGEPVWEWIREPIDDSTVPKVTNAIRVDLTREDVASWSCSLVDSVDTSSQNQQTAP